MNIPDMGARRIGDFLEHHASHSTGSIVEVGSWLGAGTVRLALGAVQSKQKLFVYDRWSASVQEQEKARLKGVDLEIGQNLLPLVRANVDPVGAEVEYVRGDIRKATFTGPPIGVYVDDAAKTEKLFLKVLNTFAPHWLDGALIVLMDFYYFKKAGRRFEFQSQVVARFKDHFSPVDLPGQNSNSSNAAFRYHYGDGAFDAWTKAIRKDSAILSRFHREVRKLFSRSGTF